MPDFPFTNQQTVHVTHPFGTTHIPVYVEAEGFERIVEKSYGDGYVDILFGRVMSSGLVSYASGGGSTVLVNTEGSIGRTEHGGTGSGAGSRLTSQSGSSGGRGTGSDGGHPVSGTFNAG
jgi:hypothetical protein